MAFLNPCCASRGDAESLSLSSVQHEDKEVENHVDQKDRAAASQQTALETARDFLRDKHPESCCILIWSHLLVRGRRAQS